MALSSNRLSRELICPRNSALLVEHLFRGVPLDNNSSMLDIIYSEERIVSSFLNTTSTIMELIRLNNSDYFEQYLFHTAREQLMLVQQEAAKTPNVDLRQLLENAMEDVMSKVGLVNMTSFMNALLERMHLLQSLLKRPRSSVRVPPVNNDERAL